MCGQSGGLKLTLNFWSGSLAIHSLIIEMSMHAMVKVAGMVTVLVGAVMSVPSEDSGKKWRWWERGGD